jgi:HSP20 family protein
MNKQEQAGCGPAGRSYWRQRYGYHHYAGNRRAPVSIYKTDKTYELMLFAPGREKENFQVQLKGDELIISYKPTTDTSNLEWVRMEYRGGFERSFMMDPTMDASALEARYENGVMIISIPFKPGNDAASHEVKVN